MKKLLALALLLSVPVFAQTLAQTAPSESQQRLACLGDAFRLCAGSIPDRAKIRACLGQRHDQLSDGCRVVYDASIKAGQ